MPLLLTTSLAAALSPAFADPAAPTRNPLAFDYAHGSVTLSLEANLSGLYSQNTYWGIGSIFSPGYPNDYTWGEAYAKPGVRWDHRFSDAFSGYAGATVVASGTAGEDIVQTEDVAAVSMDSLYGGFRLEPGGAAFIDVSAGAQPYAAGTGMLIGDGAPEGSARGAVTIAPFQAWDQAAILRLGAGGFKLDAFYLDADEIYEPDTYTELAGGKLQYDIRPNEFVGIVGGQVIASDATYLRALPGGAGSAVIPDAREGLGFLNAYARVNPFPDLLSGFYVSGDVAYEWNDRIDMAAWGGRVGVGNTFAGLPMTPTLSYNFHSMSGDDPETETFEGFDPLFNTGADWALGANSALIFANTNVNVHRLGLNLVATPRDLIGIKYFHIRSNQVQSPIVVDPSSVIPSAVSSIEGLSKEIANEVAIDYTHVFTRNIFLNTALLYSHPGSLLREFAGEPEDWYAATASLMVKF